MKKNPKRDHIILKQKNDEVILLGWAKKDKIARYSEVRANKRFCNRVRLKNNFSIMKITVLTLVFKRIEI